MADETARAFWIAAPGKGEIRRERLPVPSKDDVVIRARYSGISRGTEALVYNGRVPPSEFDRMRAPFQAGDFPAPVKYGYSSVGCVEVGPEAIQGKHVFVLFPHQTRYVVPAAAASLVPDDVPLERAVLAANLETAINIVWDANIRVGDRVSVIGSGAVGCLVAWLARRIPGCDVELVDVNRRRASIALAFGVGFSDPSSARRNADVVVHASGSPAGLALALDAAGFESTVVEASWYGTQSVPLPLGEAFHARRLTLKSSQVGSVAAVQRARWDTRRRLSLALSLLSDPVLDTLISGESDFESLPDVMASLSNGAGDALCHRVRYT